MKLCDDGGDATVGARAEGLAGPKRRARVLRTASAQFALTGLHGTPALKLAKAAEISEAILYVHFGDKTQLFREAVEINSETRLRSLDRHLSLIAGENQIDWIESMAEATMMICLAGASNALLMGWALLEAPEFATDLYRNEIGSVRGLWDREVARGFLPPGREKLSRSKSFRTRSTLAWPTASGLRL